MIENTNSRRYEKMTDDDDEIIVVPTNLTKEEDTFFCVRHDDFSFRVSFSLFCPRDKKIFVSWFVLSKTIITRKEHEANEKTSTTMQIQQRWVHKQEVLTIDKRIMMSTKPR